LKQVIVRGVAIRGPSGEFVISVFVGFDPREAVAYHTFCQSVLENASQPVSFVPLVL